TQIVPGVMAPTAGCATKAPRARAECRTRLLSGLGCGPPRRARSARESERQAGAEEGDTLPVGLGRLGVIVGGRPLRAPATRRTGTDDPPDRPRGPRAVASTR